MRDFDEIFSDLTSEAGYESGCFLFTKEQLRQLILNVAFATAMDSKYFEAIYNENEKGNKNGSS